MSKLYLLTYATESHSQIRRDLITSAVNSHQFDDFFTYKPEHIDSDFYKKNQHILNIKNGSKTTGAFLWKPYFILKSLEKIDDGDVILYMDCGDGFISTANFKNRVFESIEGQDMILTNGGFLNKDWTRRDVFVYMGCDDPKYWNAIQLEAGIGLYKKTESTIRFVKEWLYFGQDVRIIGDGDIENYPDSDGNYCLLKNYEGFMSGRWDQSILTILWKKYGINSSDFLRNYIKCNVNEPEIK